MSKTNHQRRHWSDEDEHDYTVPKKQSVDRRQRRRRLESKFDLPEGSEDYNED